MYNKTSDPMARDNAQSLFEKAMNDMRNAPIQCVPSQISEAEKLRRSFWMNIYRGANEFDEHG